MLPKCWMKFTETTKISTKKYGNKQSKKTWYTKHTIFGKLLVVKTQPSNQMLQTCSQAPGPGVGQTRWKGLGQAHQAQESERCSKTMVWLVVLTILKIY